MSHCRHPGRRGAVSFARLGAIVLFSAAALCASRGSAAPPFDGTVFIDPDIITPADPTSFVSATYIGRGLRTMYDRRVDAFVTVNAHLVDAKYADASHIEVEVNPEFSHADAVGMARKFGRAVGQLPAVLRRDVDALWVQGGLQPFGGGNRSILIHTEQAAEYGALLEEALVHEASHTSLHFESAPGWRAAQQADHEFISTYAHDFPDSEDVPESFLPYLAVRLRPDRIDAATRDAILHTIPNRIFYFDTLAGDLRPMSPAPGVTAGNGGPSGSTYELETLLARGPRVGRELLRVATGPGDFRLIFDGKAESLPAYCCGS